MKEIIFVVLDTNVWVAGINFKHSKSRKILEAGGFTFQSGFVGVKRCFYSSDSENWYFLSRYFQLIKQFLKDNHDSRVSKDWAPDFFTQVR